MSEAAPERTARAPAPRGGGNFLTKKYGPLPGWGWAAVGAVGGVVFIWYRNRKSASTAAATTTAADTTAATDTGNPGADSAAIQSEVEQLQGTVSEQETDIGQQEGSEKREASAAEAATDRRQAAAATKRKAAAEAEQDQDEAERRRKRPPAGRPVTRAGGTGRGTQPAPRRRKAPARKKT